jgi:hypothetical protein
MDEGCGGHPTLDALLPGHQPMVCDCVVKGAELVFSLVMDTMDLVLASDCWCTVQDRTPILMTPRLRELRIKELIRGLDTIKKHMVSGNLGTACERLYATYSELKVISRKRKA